MPWKHSNFFKELAVSKRMAKEMATNQQSFSFTKKIGKKMILYFTAVVRGAGLGKIRHITAVGKDYLLGREQCDAFACSKQPKQAHKNVRVLA